jgi:hypothetical protein
MFSRSALVLPPFILVLASLLYSLVVLDSGRSLTTLNNKILEVILPLFILILSSLLYSVSISPHLCQLCTSSLRFSWPGKITSP